MIRKILRLLAEVCNFVLQNVHPSSPPHLYINFLHLFELLLLWEGLYLLVLQLLNSHTTQKTRQWSWFRLQSCSAQPSWFETSGWEPAKGEDGFLWNMCP